MIFFVTMTTEKSALFGIRNPMYVHIAIELGCLLVLVIYVRRSTRRLEDQIRDLNQIVQQQQEMIHTHQKILQRYGWGTSSTAKATPNLEVEISDLSKMFRVPFAGEEVVILPHPTLSTPPSSEPYADQTIVEEVVPPPPTPESSSSCPDEEAEADADAPTTPSIEDEIAEEIQELVEEEKKHQEEIPI